MNQEPENQHEPVSLSHVKEMHVVFDTGANVKINNIDFVKIETKRISETDHQTTIKVIHAE